MDRPRTARLALVVVVSLVVGALPGSVAAGAAGGRDRAEGVVTPTTAELERFVADELEPRLDDEHVPGAVISVVHEGEVVLSSGVGLADVARGVPFDPERSLVRIASITKLFTWTAVMQLVGRGVVELDDDVARYLPDGVVPGGSDDPITLADLMSHTAGFEERAIGVGARSAADVAPLAEFLRQSMPARIRPPGRASAYSNHGAALAGLVVEEVTGLPWHEYVREAILEPLAMTRTTAAEPPPPELARDLATGYDWTGEGHEPIPFIFDRLPPDGSISSTATDMAQFMLAHLGHGTPILQGHLLEQMHERSFSLDDRIDGYAHGFKERTFAGQRALMHDGSWQGFQSALVLFPDLDVGLFVSMNDYGGAVVLPEVIDAFVDRFVPPRRRPVGPPPAASDVDPREFEGFYQPTRHNDTTVERVLTLVGSTRLSIHDTGATFRGDEWVEVAPLLYEQVDGDQRLALVAGPDGERYVATDATTYEAVAAIDTLRVNLALLALGMLPVVAAVAWPAAALHRRRHTHRIDGRWRVARWLALGASLLAVTFLTLLVVLLAGDTSAFVYGVPTSTRVLMALPVVFGLAGVLGAVVTVRAWRAAPGRLARAHQVTLLVGVAVVGWFTHHWNLLPWKL